MLVYISFLLRLYIYCGLTVPSKTAAHKKVDVSYHFDLSLDVLFYELRFIFLILNTRFVLWKVRNHKNVHVLPGSMVVWLLGMLILYDFYYQTVILKHCVQAVEVSL